MPPIKEATQQTAGASAPLDLPTQSDEVDPGPEQVNASACISGAGAANTARCGWETDMEKRTRATEQRMSAAEEGISATEQRMSAAEEGINATEQRVRVTEQLGRETRRELGEIRELLQAALPNAANVAAATASCSQEATMATINTGIEGCLIVLPIEAQGIKFGVFTISQHVRVSEKISDNLVCTLKFDRVSTVASEISVKQQGFSLAVRPGDGGNPLSMSVQGLMQIVRYFCDIPDLHVSVPDETWQCPGSTTLLKYMHKVKNISDRNRRGYDE